MKKDLNETIGHIQKALRSLGPDFATLDLRGLLVRALNEAQHVDKKRKRRGQSAYQEMVKKGMSFHDKWWKTIEENVRNANKKAEEETQQEENEEDNNR